MSLFFSVLLGIGVALVLASWIPRQERATRRIGYFRRILSEAGYFSIPVGAFLSLSLLMGIVVFAGVAIVTLTPAIAACFALMAAGLPTAMVLSVRRKRQSKLLEEWPDAVDHLRSSIRAGRTLAEALVDLSYRGPVPLRDAFEEFAADHRAGATFEVALDRLKDRLADPVGDRVVESLRVTAQVGGHDVGRLLGTLSLFLREASRTRRELEARQSWTINAARLAVAAPWIVLGLLGTRPEAVQAYNSPMGAMILGGGLVVSVLCYRLMMIAGALPRDVRVLV